MSPQIQSIKDDYKRAIKTELQMRVMDNVARGMPDGKCPPEIEREVLAINSSNIGDYAHFLGARLIENFISSRPLTPRAKKVLALARKNAETTGANYIGAEHILKAALSECGEASVVAPQQSSLARFVELGYTRDDMVKLGFL